MRFEPLPPPTQAEVEKLLKGVRHRVLQLVENGADEAEEAARGLLPSS
ncbi:hypothetical protein DB31_6260 [Hyalangium minutum]|uniref:Uncharacterized protein n=1 Tax=Hyalangium minutum TaxID=394096 RepID=A0A085VSU7_9BACT|nr:hypothetical protein DB31_6260 [Hyalangium minutum]